MMPHASHGYRITGGLLPSWALFGELQGPYARAGAQEYMRDPLVFETPVYDFYPAYFAGQEL